jgi:hypothetical protein
MPPNEFQLIDFGSPEALSGIDSVGKSQRRLETSVHLRSCKSSTFCFSVLLDVVGKASVSLLSVYLVWVKSFGKQLTWRANSGFPWQLGKLEKTVRFFYFGNCFFYSFNQHEFYLLNEDFYLQTSVRQ